MVVRVTLAGIFFTIAVLAGILENRPLAADWPEFRGPTGQGHATYNNLPIHWGTDQNISWKQAIPGKGWSSPIVINNQLFLTSAMNQKDGDNWTLEVLCLDALNGKTVWRQPVFEQDGKTAPKIHNKNSHASPTLLYANDQLFAHFGHQGTACLDKTGKILWQTQAVQYAPVHGNGGSPILVNGTLIFSADGSQDPMVVGLDAKTGDIRWKTPRAVEADREFSFSTPLLIEVAGQMQVISPASNMVGAYDPHTGKEIWRVTYDGYSVIPRPVFGHQLLFICTGYNSPKLLAIRPDGKGDVTNTHVAWRENRNVPHTPSLLLVKDDLYMVADNGVASCLNARSGTVHWRQRLRGAYSASPMYAHGHIYFQNEQGLTTVVKESQSFTQVATNDLKQRSLASFAASNGAIFLRTEEFLYRIEKTPVTTHKN